jgi:Flp pilus assembly protein TadB
MRSARTIGRFVAVLLVMGAFLFVLGAILERDDHHQEPAAAVPAASGESPGSAPSDEAVEATEGGSNETTGSHSERSDERVLGLNGESSGLVAVGVAASLVLSAFAWLKPRPVVFVVVAVFAAAFTVLDVAEAAHQLDRSDGGLAALAMIVAVVHVGALVSAALGAATGRSDTRPIVSVAAR